MLALQSLALESEPQTGSLKIVVPTVSVTIQNTALSPQGAPTLEADIAAAVATLWGYYYGEIHELVHMLRQANANGAWDVQVTCANKIASLVDPSHAATYIHEQFGKMRASQLKNAQMREAAGKVVLADPSSMLNLAGDPRLNTVPASGGGYVTCVALPEGSSSVSLTKK